jgi:hypothetical protein
MADPKTTTALVRFEPENINEAIALATHIAESSLIPAALRGKKSDVLVMFLTGHDLGLSAMQSLQSIHIIEGIPRLSSKLKVALCLQKTSVCKYFRLVESTDKIATYVTLREGNDQPNRMSFTIEQAKEMGLIHPTQSGKPNRWMLDPSAQLRARASGRLADAIYPDVCLNLGDEDEEEMEDEPRPADPRPPPKKVEVLSNTVVPPTTPAAPVAKAVPVAAVAAEVVNNTVVPEREPGCDDGDPAPAAPAAPAEDPWATKITELTNALNACQTQAEVQALMPDLQKIPKDRVGPLRDLYVSVMAKFTPATEKK